MELLEYCISTPEELSKSCLPFIKGGGLFFKTLQKHKLGEIISISLRLLNHPETIKFEGKIVWITPPHEQTHLPQGVGVQFPEEQAQSLREIIQSFQADAFSEKSGML